MGGAVDPLELWTIMGPRNISLHNPHPFDALVVMRGPTPPLLESLGPGFAAGRRQHTTRQ
jgi:hypothetical protein